MSYSSKRELAVQAIVTRLADVTVAKGYNTDAGSHIYEGEVPQLGPDDETAALAVTLDDDSVEARQGEHVICDLLVTVHAVIPDTLATPLRSVEAIVTDIKRAVEKTDRTLGGVLMNRGLTRGSTRVKRREVGSKVVGAAVEYRLQFGEVWGAP